MAEVWGHPWMKGSLPTELEVKEYFRAINEFYHAERGDAIVEREELLGLQGIKRTPFKSSHKPNFFDPLSSIAT